MFNQKDLYAALQNGTNPEQIAQQFADALNGAIAQQNKEKVEAEVAKKAEAAAKKQARIAAINSILDSVQEFIKEFYPDMYNPEMLSELDAAELDKAIEQAYKETIAMMGPFQEIMKMRNQFEAQNAKPVATVIPQDADAALRAFLTRNGF